MKKVLLIGFLTLSIGGFAQNPQPDLIRALPQYTQGFLVFNEDAADDIDAWNVDLTQRIFHPNGEFDKDVLIKSTVLFDVNYIEIPKIYYTDAEHYYYITVTAFNSNKEIIGIEGPEFISPYADPFVTFCYGQCNGENFAWQIDYMAAITGNPPTVLSLNNTYKSIDAAGVGVPFYQYMDWTQYSIITAPFATISSPDFSMYATSFYNVTNTWLADPANTGKIIHIAGATTAMNLKDMYGNVLTGSVYGINKTLGPWITGNYFQATNLADGPGSMCVLPVAAGITQMNLGSDIIADGYPALYCNGYASSGASTGDGTFGDVPPFQIICGTEMIDFEGNIYDLTEAFCLCINQIWPDDACTPSPECCELLINPLSPGGFNQVTISQYDTDGFETIELTQDVLFSPNGEFIGPSFTLEPGLYTIGFIMNDGTYHPVYKDVEKPLINSMEMADFLTPTIFPVPIIDQEFEINMVATAKLKFDYVLMDFSGNELYRKNFVIQKDHNRNHTIKPKDDMESGMYVNKFIFEDGSEISMTTIKP